MIDMSITGGHTANVLRVDLTNQRISALRVSPGIQKSLVGGAGIAAKILLDEVQPSIDSLGPANRLILTAGPLGGIFQGGREVDGLRKVTIDWDMGRI